MSAAEADITASRKYGFAGTPEDVQRLEKAKEAEKQAQASFVSRPGEEKLEKVEAKQTKNEEADNVISAQESMADSLKENNIIIKELLDTTKEQLDTVKVIRDSLAPKDNQEEDARNQKKEKFYSDVTGKLDEISGKLDNVGSGGLLPGLPGLPDIDIKGKGKAPGKPSLGSRILGGLKSAGPGLLKGGLGAIGGMALGYGADKLIESGNEKVGGALGVGAEALSGAGMGAMIGSVVPGIGTAVGGAVGGIAGGAYGLYKNWGNLFGGDKKQELAPINTTTGAAGFPIQPEGPVNVTTGAAGFPVQPANKPAATKPVEKKEDFSKDYTKDPRYQEILRKEQDIILGGKIRIGSDDEGKLSARDMVKAEKSAKEIYLSKTEAKSPDPQLARVKNAPNVEPVKRPGSELGPLSLEYNDQMRETAQSKPSPAPLIMNNSSSNNTTSFVPMKATPRPEYSGSALDRYQSRISTY